MLWLLPFLDNNNALKWKFVCYNCIQTCSCWIHKTFRNCLIFLLLLVSLRFDDDCFHWHGLPFYRATGWIVTTSPMMRLTFSQSQIDTHRTQITQYGIIASQRKLTLEIVERKVCKKGVARFGRIQWHNVYFFLQN